MYFFPLYSWRNSPACPLPLLETKEKQMTPNFPFLIKMLNGVKMPGFIRDICSPGELFKSCWGSVQWELFESRHVIKFPNVISPDILMETFSFLLISMWFGLKALGLGAPRCPSVTKLP